MRRLAMCTVLSNPRRQVAALHGQSSSKSHAARKCKAGTPPHTTCTAGRQHTALWRPMPRPAPPCRPPPFTWLNSMTATMAMRPCSRHCATPEKPTPYSARPTCGPGGGGRENIEHMTCVLAAQ